MRNDVLGDELRHRLGSSEEAIRAWFNSLRPADRIRLLEIIDEQIQTLQRQPDQDVGRQNSLESIKKWFSTWMSPDVG